MYKLATCKYKVGEAFETDIFPKNIKIKGLAPERKAKKNTRCNCQFWVQLG